MLALPAGVFRENGGDLFGITLLVMSFHGFSATSEISWALYKPDPKKEEAPIGSRFETEWILAILRE